MTTELQLIEAAREAVLVAAQRIQVLRATTYEPDTAAALQDAWGAIQDAFDNAVGSTELRLKDEEHSAMQRAVGVAV